MLGRYTILKVYNGNYNRKNSREIEFEKLELAFRTKLLVFSKHIIK